VMLFDFFGAWKERERFIEWMCRQPHAFVIFRRSTLVALRK